MFKKRSKTKIDGWMKGVFRPFQRIIRLYQDSNLRRDEMKDEGP